ncbi:MAG: hypothetical protein M1812_002721 [Candelaria pacifica]|nr:MAG: hypothetical protein M1812_002721 [Candelaria pacifica]
MPYQGAPQERLLRAGPSISAVSHLCKEPPLLYIESAVWSLRTHNVPRTVTLSDLESASSILQSLRQRTLLSSFSRSEGKQVHTLGELFRTIQSLGLELFDGAQIQDRKLLGEGASYKVYKCSDRRSQSVVAIKQVKLPPTTANDDAFANRVACVLRDILVTRHEPLAAHENIVRLLGLGWNTLNGGSPIPFLVTEWAKFGTLREYLTTHQTSVHQRLSFCRDVHSGLYEMHLCDVAHGDLKLENVLACVAATGSDGKDIEVVAKISDFGASILLSPEQYNGEIEYRGTPGYNPPETLERADTLPAFDIRKCDMWTLGLLCWESLLGGKHFYDHEHAEISSALSSSQDSTTSELSGTTLQSDTRSSLESTLRKLFTLRGKLAVIAFQSLTSSSCSGFDRNKRSTLWKSLNNLLNEDPTIRSSEALLTPLFYPNGIPRITVPRAKLVQYATSGYEWDFETFKPKQMSTTPASAKLRMLSDFQRMTSHQDPAMSSRAKLHVAFAHGEGFGVPRSLLLFRDWARRSADSGNLPVAGVIFELIENSFRNVRYAEGRNAADRYHRTITKAIRRLFTRPLLNGIDHKSTYHELETAAQKAAEGVGVSPIPAAIYAVHHSLTHRIPRGARINQQDAMTGETALHVACRTGEPQAARKLLDLGADASICSHNGSFPLHWLFMFNDEEVDYFASRFTKEAWYSQHVNARTSKPVQLDCQLPLVLHGTPLAFATATASCRAIDALLEAGGDPLLGQEVLDEHWGSRSPLVIAASLHLDEILSRLWLKVLGGLPKMSTAPEDLASLPHALSSASSIERRLIHGTTSVHAPEKLARLVWEMNYSLRVPGITHHDFSPLETAISVSNVNVTKALLKNYYSVGGHPDQQAKDQALFFAIKTVLRGNLDIQASIALLDSVVAQGCNINARSKAGRAVDILINSYQEEILKWLLTKGPRLDYLNSDLRTPLHHMLTNKLYLTTSLDILLSRGADPNIPEERTGKTPLHLAAELHASTEVEALLKYSASRTLKDKSGDSPLHCAVKSGAPEVISILLKDSSDIELSTRDANGRTCLHLAVLQGSTAMMTLMLARGASCSIKDRKGKTPLHAAAEIVNHAALEILLSHFPVVDALDDAGNTPLQLAIQPRKELRRLAYSCVSTLLEAGADPNVQTLHPSYEGGQGTLHTVFRYFQGDDRLCLIKLLFKKGASLNDQDYTGTSILHLAAFMGDVHMVDYLVTSGAEPDLKGMHGQTALHDCVRQMMIDGKPRETWESERCKIIHSLVNAGADIAQEDIQGRTPLDLVAANGFFPLATELLSIHQAGSGGLVGTGTDPVPDDSPTLPEKYSQYSLRQHVSVPFGRTKSASWATAVERKHWAYVAFVISTGAEVDMSCLEGRAGMELLVYALKLNDTILLQAFTGQPTPKPMGSYSYPWPPVRIPQNAARYLELARLRYEIFQEETRRAIYKLRHPLLGKPSIILKSIKHAGPFERVKQLLNDEKGYETHDIVHSSGFGIRSRSALTEIWDFISGWCVEDARTGFYPDQINQLIYLVGTAQNSKGGRARVQAIGSETINSEGADVPCCSIPLGLVYEVWMVPDFSRLRLGELNSILAGYSNLEKNLKEDTGSFKEIVRSQIESIDRYINQLKLDRESFDLHSILSEQIRWVLEAISQEESKRAVKT